MPKKISAIAIKGFAVLVVLGTVYLGRANQAMAQDAVTPYSKMAPVEQYLMERNAEISWRGAPLRFHLQRRDGLDFGTAGLRDGGRR